VSTVKTSLILLRCSFLSSAAAFFTHILLLLNSLDYKLAFLSLLFHVFITVVIIIIQMNIVGKYRIKEKKEN